MQEDSLTYHLLNDTIEATELYSDSIVTTTILQPLEREQKEMPRHAETFDWIFGIFLICFIFLSSIVGKRVQILPSVISDLFYIKKRRSIFSETTTNEWYGKLFLCFQTCLLLSLFLCKYFTFESPIVLESPIKMILLVLLITLILCIFFALKWAAYYIVGSIFFDKLSLKIWIGNFFSLLAFMGIFLFIPVLLYFYTNTPHNFVFFFIIASLVLFEGIVIYKLIVLFFHKQRLLLYLFLYLCGQEVIPLFFLWKTVGFVFNNFVEKSALWLWI